MPSKNIVCLSLAFLIIGSASAQKITIDRNKPKHKVWFSGQGAGFHLDFSLESQVGKHGTELLNASSAEYQDWYFNELPGAFNPKEFDPERLATLLKSAGIEYVLITARQFDGFCMWDTKTTDFNVMNSGYGKDILKESIDAFRKQDIAIGLYFSPDNFHFMRSQGYELSRESAESSSTSNTALWELNKQQLTEILTDYGDIDLLYIDERSDWANLLVANHVWNLKPEMVITGGAMMVFENYLPQKDIPDEWIGYFSLTATSLWDSATKLRGEKEIIRLLVETRSKGGNFMLSISPNAYGKIPEDQEAILRDVTLWHRINKAAISNVKPWHIQYENGCRFTASEEGKTVYVFIDQPDWKPLEEKAFFFRSIMGYKDTGGSVLGMAENAIEYPWNKPLNLVVSSVEEGLFISLLKRKTYGSEYNLPIAIRLENVGYRESKSGK